MSRAAVAFPLCLTCTESLNALAFPLADVPNRCSCRTTRGCRLYRSSHAGCRFGRSGSNGFVGGFHLLRLSSCIPAPKVRNCRNRCRNRYTFRPKQIRFLLQGRLKRLRFSDGLCLSFCPRHCSCTPKFLSYHLF